MLPSSLKFHLDRQPVGQPGWFGNILGGERAAIFSKRVAPVGTDTALFPLNIWKMPVEDNDYTVAIDPTAGKRHARAGIQAIDCLSREQVAEICFEEKNEGEISLERQAYACVWLSSFYNQARLVIEVNGPIGQAMVDYVQNRLKYTNLWEFRNHPRNNVGAIRHMMDLLSNERVVRSFRLRNDLSSFFEQNGIRDLAMAMMMAQYCSAHLNGGKRCLQILL